MQITYMFNMFCTLLFCIALDDRSLVIKFMWHLRVHLSVSSQLRDL